MLLRRLPIVTLARRYERPERLCHCSSSGSEGSTAWCMAIANLGGSMALGLVAIFLGLTLGRAL